MDDSCAVCAESLEWVAYGACGHREVCSTCVSRLRLICEDRRCCICKTELDVVFVTKALGDYTTTISDFSLFPSNSTEGKNGSYWYHEDTVAYFDDFDHYKMVKAMCRLSCSVCDDNIDPDASKRKPKFRNIDQLKHHLAHRHKLFMCTLCLEGRKIFICEQKLYTRAQLNQHVHTGDSDVDGTESERGGFMGHPICEFCRKPFYGDNELYSHMSTEHYTCHICQRQHPGQFEYYKNYDDLEMHFRSVHFLCENEGCLAKKFIVFSSESEMKRHNATEHGGHMSRSKRNAVLQIPTSFRYRRSNEQDHRRGSGRGFHPDSSENQLSLAIQASLETSTTDYRNHDPSSNVQTVPDQREMNEVDKIVAPFESLATTDSDGSSRYRQALGQSSRNLPLEESSFPPLPVTPAGTKQKQNDEGLGKNTLAARLRRRNNGTINVLNSAKPWSTTTHGSASSSSGYGQARTTSKQGLVPSSISVGPSLAKTATSNDSVSSNASSAQVRPTPNHGLASSSSASSSLAKPPIYIAPVSSSYASTAQARPASSSLLWNTSSTARIGHSVSAPNLVERASLDSSMSEFPPVSATQKNKLPTSSQLKVEDVQTANKSLVERIRSALDSDENKYTAFKELSADFRLGVLGTAEYLSYVQEFGLSHLVLELARLCPDSQKQRELLETYNASVRCDSVRENGLNISRSKGSNKGKGKYVEGPDSGSKDKISVRSSKDTLANDIISTVKKLQSNYKPSEEEVEVLSKDGYRRSNGNSKVPPIPAEPPAKSNGPNDTQSSGAGGGRQRKKTSKFHRLRLGNGFDQEPDVVPEHEDTSQLKENSSSERVLVRGVWRNGGGQRLVALTQKDPAK